MIAGISGAVGGCTEKVDPKFAAETYDEYAEPLADAVIGTPEGTKVIGPGGETTFLPAALAAGAPRPGAGGSTGVAGRMGAGGSTGTAGSLGAGGSVGGSFGAGGSVGGSFGAGGSVGMGGIPGGDGGVATGGSGFGGQIGSGGISGGGGGSGFWHFDDCSPTSHFLIDSSGFGANATQPLNAACVPGLSGQGVQIRSGKDIIQVPDEPQFTVTDRVAVAAWVHPNTVAGNQPIVIKRLNNQTSFSLGIHNGNIEMSVVLSTGKTLISSAPISAGVWTHVAGMYDGTFVFLFINGQQFGQVFGGATLRNVFAPLRFGATTQSQYLDGTIDEVFVSTQNISKDTLTALSCIGRPSGMTVTPLASAPTPPDTSAPFTVTVTDNDLGACQPKSYNMFINSFEPGINTSFDPPGPFQSALPGQTLTFTVEVTGTEDAEPGTHDIQFIIGAFQPTGGAFEQLGGQFVFNLQAPTGCFVSTRRELMITDTSVVDDPVRSVADGAWSFG
ncbi:MAG TPA: LamG-like jellyroll fold domain-containing protein, partial [Polyangia bacterium]|nr:LamG-like jellyroll fold domain-containing protein [Polyangia bacterium]